MKLLKRTCIVSLALLSVLPILGCKDKNCAPKICNYEIIHEPEFGGVYVKITIDDFNDKGFKYGDSVDVKFSNDFELLDIPYYNGYYVDAGNPLVISYPGYDYVKVAINYGQDVWELANLNDDDLCSIKLNKKKKYYDVQMSSDIHYTDRIEDYDNDVIQFSNFRNVTVGNIKENVVYRAASPIDNQHLRAHYVDELIKDNEVKYVMDLSDNNTKIDGHIAKEDFNSNYFKSLYDNGKVSAVAMNMNYYSSDFAYKIGEGFKAFSQNEGPYLIHCVEGKDRTGFVCMVLEALCGATYQEIVDDYMLTYKNYYKFDEKSDKTKYDIIKKRNIDTMLRFLVDIEIVNFQNPNVNLLRGMVENDPVDYTTVDLSLYAKNFLLLSGMTNDEITNLINNVTK